MITVADPMGMKITTVACEKLDLLYFLNNSLNIERRTPIHSVISQSGMKHGLSGIHVYIC